MNGDDQSAPPVLRPSGRPSCPITSAQQLVYDLHACDPNNVAATCRFRLLLEGPIDRDVLARCLDELIARHAVLGMRFAEVDGRIHQFIPTARHALELEHASFAGLGQTAEDARWIELFDRIGRPFDLARGPLIRCALVALAPDRHVLAVVIHHIAFDQGSIAEFVAELGRGYRAVSIDAAWPEPELGYIDLAAYLDALAHSAVGGQQRAFWAAQLAGAAPVELPIDRSRATLDRRRAAHPRGIAPMPAAEVATVIGPDLRAAIAELARGERASPYMVLLAGLAAVVYRARAQPALTVQSRYSLRARPETADLIGYVSNATLVRIETSGAPSYRDLVARARRAVLDAWRHSDVPITERAPHALRRINVNYAVAPSATRQPLAPGLSVTRLPAPMDVSTYKIPFDLHFVLRDATDGTTVRLLYVPELFDAATARTLVTELVAVIGAMCEHPDAKL